MSSEQALDECAGSAGGDRDVDRPGLSTAGLDGDRARQVIASDEYAAAVRADRREGEALGVSGVPFVVFDRKVAAPGAQSAEVYGRILDQIVDRVPPKEVAHG